MKLKKILLLVFMALGFLSCNDEPDEIIFIPKDYGKLVVIVKDADGQSIPDIVVDANYFTEKTDENGKIDFGNVFADEYDIEIDDITVDGVEYYISKPVQVFSGQTKKVEIIPEEYVGTIEIEVTDFYGPVVGYYVMIVQDNDAYDEATDLDELKALQAIGTGVTNINGMVTITDIPSDIPSVAIIYDSAGNYETNTFEVEKDEATEKEYNVNFK